MGAAEEAFRRRLMGLDRTGTVSLRSFDEGVITTLGATIGELPNGVTGYFTDIPGACGPAGSPGVPVVFAYPDDSLKNYQLPTILVKREDISAAMERWQPAATQYKTTGLGALPVSLTLGGKSLQGFDRIEQLAQAIPYDIIYTISIRGRYRGTAGAGTSQPSQRNAVNAIFQHLLRTYPPYGKVNVIDSIGDLRCYEAFNESIANIDTTADVTEKTVGFAITLRVEAELDLKDPITVQTVKRPLTKNTRQL